MALLVVGTAVVPASLPGVALRENRRAVTQFGDVNRSGSLRARRLQLYALGSRGEDSRAALADMAADTQTRAIEARARLDVDQFKSYQVL